MSCVCLKKHKTRDSDNIDVIIIHRFLFLKQFSCFQARLESFLRHSAEILDVLLTSNPLINHQISICSLKDINFLFLIFLFNLLIKFMAMGPVCHV